jgi:hypothetical protein
METNDEKLNKMNDLINRTVGSSVEKPPITEAISQFRGGPKLFQDVGSRMAETGERIISGIREKGENVYEAVTGQGEYQGKSAVERGVGATAEAFSAISGVAYNSLSDKVRNSLDKIGGGIGKGFQWLTNKIGSEPNLVKLVSENPEYYNKLGDAYGVLADLGLISGEILGAEAVPAGATTLQKGITQGTKAIETGVNKIFSPIETKISRKLSSLTPVDYSSAVNSLDKAYKSAFVENKVGVNNKLTKLGSITGKTPDELISNLSKAGIAPEIEGKLAKFDKALDELTKRQNSLAESAQASLKGINAPTTLDELKRLLIEDVKKTADPAELSKSLKEVERTIESYRLKYGDTLLPESLGEIRISANKATSAFDRPIFETDVSNSIGNVVRKKLDDIIPDEAYRKVNAEWGDIADLKKTISIFNNQAVDVGVLGSQLGRLGGALALGGLATPISGPGALVIAGIAATYGGDFVASFLRNRKFSKQAQEIIKQSLKQQPDVLEELINSASKSNATYLQKLLPAPKEGAVKSQVNVPINLPAESASSFEQRQIRQIQEQLKGSSPYSNSTTKRPKGKVAGTTETNLLIEAKKYKSAEEFVKKQEPIYHGADPRNIDALNKNGVKILSPEEKLKLPSTGGGNYGISMTTDKATARNYSQALGNKNIGEFYINPNAKVKTISGYIDDIYTPAELEKLAKNYDVIKSTASESEVRILTNNGAVTKSQLTDIWNKANKK